MTTTAVTILAERLYECRDALGKLQRRAARVGQEISWTETRRLEQRGFVRVDGEQVKRMVEVVDLVLCGEAPRVGEYEFEASLERTAGGVIIASAPGVHVGKLGREWDGRCDHCGHDRARVHGFIVRKGTVRKVVGRSCLRDFLGTDVPGNVAARFAYLQELAGGDDDSWGGFRGEYRDLTVGLIAECRAAIALYGWRPSSFEGNTTLGIVDLLGRPITGEGRDDERKMQRELRAELTVRGEQYHAEAEQVVEWARGLRTRNSDYLHNLQVACSGEVVRGKHRGLVASASAAYDRQVARENERKEAAKATAALPSEWVGQPGERLRDVPVVLAARRALPDNGFGESTAFTFVRDDGARFGWLTGTGSRDLFAAPMGTRFKMTATVKRHTEFRDVKETRVSRAKLERLAA